MPVLSSRLRLFKKFPNGLHSFADNTPIHRVPWIQTEREGGGGVVYMKSGRSGALEPSIWLRLVRDVVNSIGDAGSTRPGQMPMQVHLSKFIILPWRPIP